MRDAGFRGHVGESAVAVVLEEMRSGFVPFGEAFVSGAVDEEDVEPAIVVVIVEGDPAAGSLEEIFIFVLASEDGLRVEARFFSDGADAQSQVVPGLRRGYLTRQR